MILTLAPHPSLLIVLVHHYLETLQSPVEFIIHLLVTYTLTFCAFCSFIICIVRDPGPITVEEAHQDDDDALDITQALMSADSPGDEDISSPGKFCRKCWAPKPERVRRPICLGVYFIRPIESGSPLWKLWSMRIENGFVMRSYRLKCC